MKKYEIGLTISVLLTFSLTMIVIFTGVFIQFFSINDFTIIAAIIGVVGAVIGGAISGGLTLSGVRYTIKHEKDIRKKEQIPQKIELLRKSERLIKTIIIQSRRDRIAIMAFGHFNNKRDDLYDYASKIDHDCYNKLLQIENTIDEYQNIGSDRSITSDGKMPYTKDALSVFKKYTTSVKEYEELMRKKMKYYQTELSE